MLCQCYPDLVAMVAMVITEIGVVSQPLLVAVDRERGNADATSRRIKPLLHSHSTRLWHEEAAAA